jgi:hypothetical protein
MDAAALEQKALPIPEGLDAPEDQVLELARVWWNGSGPVMNLRPALAEPGNVGIVLAEMAWLYAHAYAEHRGVDQATAFKAICDSWDKSHAQVAQAAQAETAP